MADRRVVFVCQHGAFRSRLAAAFFNADPPEGWNAVSAGLTPQSEVSVRLLPLLEGTSAESFADLGSPRPFDPAQADRAIAIDVGLEGAERWTTSGEETEVRDQIRSQVAQLVHKLAD